MIAQQRGFTLVELSIVLVILGLLIGGVLTGQSLIRAAELRSVSTQHARYTTAVHTFRDKYFALPGDMTNAVSYWGAADGSTGMTMSCATTASTTPVTCNGDGNGKIDSYTPSNERFRFWQHLANAGLIEGSYIGITQGASLQSATTANTPAGKISSTLWHAFNWTSFTSGTFDIAYDNSLMFGGSAPDSAPGNPVLKPEEAYNIDMKIDDGKPATGKVVIVAPSLNQCTTTSTATTLTADYRLLSTAIGCAFIFRQQF